MKVTEHGEIDPKFVREMNNLAYDLDWRFNGDLEAGKSRKVGFALLTWPFGEAHPRVNYIGNGKREDVATAMREVLARWDKPQGSE